ncbi:hypothetical protein [Halobiforma nitratireducens]|uniref:Uncharacterized protein n=1 Tax=Halobiforma nitratireducens JCM 10879 TaxID=1227454 RepID=M0MJK8_9EURY|nr:hypothetical protein [Halobiforma nitratireducens]EMA45528.1 hypothetical protein C446_02125 [Halobiforma nitratireducens JCM 10879]
MAADNVDSGRDERDERVRDTVRDGVYDAVGTVALLGFSLLFLAVGVRGLLEGASALGGAFLVLAAVVAAAAFDLVPPFRD